MRKSAWCHSVVRVIGVRQVAEDAVPFDAAAIDKIAETVMPATVASLVTLFLEELGERRSLVRHAIDSRDMPTLAHQAHALKSSAGTYGAPRLRQVCLTLERACLNRDQRLAIASATSLVRAIDQAAAAIREWLRRLHDDGVAQ